MSHKVASHRVLPCHRVGEMDDGDQPGSPAVPSHRHRACLCVVKNGTPTSASSPALPLHPTNLAACGTSTYCHRPRHRPNAAAMRVASSRRPDRSTQSLAIALTFSFLTPFIRPVAAAETWNPTLRFNWTLATTDAMVALSGWVPRGPGAGATMDRDMSGSVASPSLGIQFVGDGVAFWGTSNGWDSTTRLGPDKNTASVTNSDDPSFNPSYQQINAPSRPDVLWERNPPRFKAYDISINAYYGNWTLERVEVMTGFQSDKPDLALVPTRTENLVTNNNGSLNPFYNYYGRWLERDAGSGVAVCYDTAEFMAPVPPGTGYLVINGTRSPAARAFAVKVQGPSSDYLYDIVDSSYTSTIDDSMLWMTPLDPDIRYNLTFDCVSAPEGENGVRSVTFYEGT